MIRERPEGWDIDPTRFHGPNLVIFEIVTRINQTNLIRSYLPRSNMDRLPDLEEVLNDFLGRDPIFMGYLNTNVSYTVNPWNQQVADFLAYFRMLDLLNHFRQRLRFRIKKTCWQVRISKLLCYRWNYIFGSDLRLFKTMGIRDLRNFLYNHFALRTRLIWRPTQCHI